MFVSNQKFAVNGDESDVLKSVLDLALGMAGGKKIKSYHLSEANGLVFGFLDETRDGWTALPAPANTAYLVDIINHYLKSPDAKKIYDTLHSINSFGDGTVKEGWEVYHPQEPYDDLSIFYAVIAVRPALTFYAK